MKSNSGYLRVMIIFLLLGILPRMSQGQELKWMMSKADSLSKLMLTHLSDSLCLDVERLAKKNGEKQYQFQAYSLLAKNYMDYYHFEKAEYWLNKASQFIRSTYQPTPLEKARLIHTQARFSQFQNDFNVSNKLYFQVEKLIENIPEAWEFLAGTYLIHSQNQIRRNDPNLQKTLIDKAFNLILAHETPPDLLGDANIQLARYYRLMGDNEGSIARARMAETFYREAFGDTHLNVAIAIQYQSHYHDQRGDLSESIHCLERAQAIYDQLYPVHQGRLGQNAGLIGNTYRRLGRYEEAKAYLDQAIEILSIHLGNLEAPIIGDMYRRKAQVYEAQDSFSKAIQYLQNSNNYYKSATRNSRDKSRNLQALARIYQAKGMLKEAIEANQLDYQNLIESYGPDFNMLSETYRVMGMLEMQSGNLNSALAKFQLAFEKAAPAFKAFTWQDLPRPQDFVFIPPVLGIINGKAEALLALAGKEDGEEFLEHAYRTYQLGIAVIERLRSSYREEETRQLIQENGMAIYQGAIHTLWQLSVNKEQGIQIDSVLNLINQGKALLLREATIHKEAMQFAGIPDSLVELENLLRNQVYNLKYNQSRASRNSLQKKNELISLSEDLSQLHALFQEKYPSYYDLKYANPQLKVEEIQSALSPDERLLQFHWGNSLGLLYAIDKEHIQVFRIKDPRLLNQKILEFRRALSDPDFIQNQKDSADWILRQQGHELYQALLAPALQEGKEGVKKLIIIPDGMLGYLPFGQLLTKSVEPNTAYFDWPYCFRDYQISYTYSSYLMYQNRLQSEAPKAKINVATFAPSYGTRKDGAAVLSMIRSAELMDLPGAEREAKAIAKLFKGDAWLGIAATEAAFRANAADYELLHFSMHGVLNDYQPALSYLAFQQEDPSLVDSLNDNYLSMAELYGMELNAQLVALSACNSGLGQLSRAEGVISLARAFRYSGARSILMSLWSVPDQSTADMMVYFYEALKKGQSKDEALRNARLKYLATTKDPLFSHPYYWSGFVLIGDAQPVVNPSLWRNTFLGVSSFILLCFLLWRFTLRRSNTA